MPKIFHTELPEKTAKEIIIIIINNLEVWSGGK